VVKSGEVSIKGEGLTSWIWSRKWMVLREQTLSFHKDEAASSSILLWLRDIASIERTDLKRYCLFIATKDRKLWLSLKSDAELYAWQASDEIYNRSPLIDVSNPSGFIHKTHVGFDPVSGAFTGLPNHWAKQLSSSVITREDYAKNPQASIEVLEFYTDHQKRENEEMAGIRQPRIDSGDKSSVGPSRFKVGTGFAGTGTGTGTGTPPPGSSQAHDHQPGDMLSSRPRGTRATPPAVRSHTAISQPQFKTSASTLQLNQPTVVRQNVNRGYLVREHDKTAVSPNLPVSIPAQRMGGTDDGDFTPSDLVDAALPTEPFDWPNSSPTRPEAYPPSGIKPGVTSQSSQGRIPDTEITSLMTVSEVIAHLGARGCPDLKDQLDVASCSNYPISNGGYGDIYRAKLKNGTEVAIKTMRLLLNGQDKKHIKHAARELYTWSKCRHRNVQRLLGLVEFRDQIGIVSVWETNGDLSSYIQRYPEANRYQISMQIAEGLEYLHQTGIAHGDLKASNVLVSKTGVPLLADFGNATLQEYTLKFTSTITKASISSRWAAPELLEGKAAYSFPADVYALGMYESFFGCEVYIDA
ncbi:Protein kinase, partial [Ceratobasidium sp. 392]